MSGVYTSVRLCVYVYVYVEIDETQKVLEGVESTLERRKSPTPDGRHTRVR